MILIVEQNRPVTNFAQLEGESFFAACYLAIWILSVTVVALLSALIIFAVRLNRCKNAMSELEHVAALIESAPYYIAFDDAESNTGRCRHDSHQGGGEAPNTLR